MENVKEPASTVDMTVEVFKAMSKASGENIRFMYSMAFAGGLLPKQKPEQHKDSTLADYARDALFSVRSMGGAILPDRKSIGIFGN